MTQCPNCGGEYKRLDIHLRKCKQIPKNEPQQEQTPKETIPQPSISNDPAMTHEAILSNQENSSPTNHAEPKSKPSEDVNVTPKEIYESNRSLISRFFGRQKKEVEVVKSPEDLIIGMKPYQIPDSNPKTGLGKFTNRNKDFIQVVLVSELVEPKTFWAEKTGMNRIQYKDRMYKLPRDIRGNVFFWHVDKKQPLIDIAKANQEDAESSFHELQLFNMAYSVGRAAGANDLINNLKLILIMIGLSLLLAFITIAFSYLINKDMKANDQAILDAVYALNNSIPR